MYRRWRVVLLYLATPLKSGVLSNGLAHLGHHGSILVHIHLNGRVTSWRTHTFERGIVCEGASKALVGVSAKDSRLCRNVVHAHAWLHFAVFLHLVQVSRNVAFRYVIFRGVLQHWMLFCHVELNFVNWAWIFAVVFNVLCQKISWLHILRDPGILVWFIKIGIKCGILPLWITFDIILFWVC